MKQKKKKKSHVLNADTNLKLDWCSYKAAKFAVKNWHYSRVMPAGKLVKIGVWENKKFVGAVIFGRGANNNMHKWLKLGVDECCELVRVALKNNHKTPTTRIVAIALKMLKKSNPGIKTVFSYADETNQGHKGTIYHAGNWEYQGIRESKGGGHWLIDGKLVHNRTISSKYGSWDNIPDSLRKRMKEAPVQRKHLFLYHLRK